MARRKKNLWEQIPAEYKKWFFALIFLFLGIMAIISDTKSVFGFYLVEWLDRAFWEYYKWIFAPVLIALSMFMFKEKDLHFNMYRFFGLLFFFVSITSLIWLFTWDYAAWFNVFPTLENTLGKPAVFFMGLILFFVSLFILFRFSVFSLIGLFPALADFKQTIANEKSKVSAKASRTSRAVKTKAAPARSSKKVKDEFRDMEKMIADLKAEKASLAKMKQPEALKKTTTKSKKVLIEKKKKWGWSLFQKEKWSAAPKTIMTDFGKWTLPGISLLDNNDSAVQIDENEVRRKEIEIQEKLLQFRIQVDMEGFKVWPTVTQYRLKPQSGIKLQKIVNLKKDLALALHAKSVRIQAPIPGMGVVGIEVPNAQREKVVLREVLESREFNSSKMQIPIAIWKDVNGKEIIGDLTKMPHLLIAGQTGSGKSVGMNGFLISMLYKFSPSDLKMIMIDPKRVELWVYNGIPHLLTPVINNSEKAVNSLKWCVAEMLRRYDLATQVKARNFLEYNEKVSKKEKLPYIVIVIDELADLMMSGMKKEVEWNIARIAQMARAVGMHLIVATQRPSVDVITGLIKANIPSRIAFTVASQVDSRTVIDRAGAEDLLGRWDMLYYPTGALEATRVQWVLVETHEIESVVNEIKRTIDPDMLANMQDPEIANGKSKFSGSIMEGYGWDQDEDPEIIEKAIQVVREARKGSTSLVQRKLWLWYARAAKVLDILEELWVVWPANGSKPREVFVD